MKIKILDESVSSRIAAGEIIDRPASVVRELIDNAIDAGATEIAVLLKKGGIDELSLSDNGCGMEYDDLQISVLKHSTSKISSVEDLYAVHTMGFRGEALYSIHTVSKMTITSGTDPEGRSPGHRIAFYEDQAAPEPVACRRGTKVEVKELFYNLPARKKFLKSSTAELNAVKAVVIEKIFANLSIRYSLYNDGKPIFTTPGNGEFKDAFFAVMKNEEEFAIYRHTERINDHLELTVYHSGPETFFQGRKYQSFYVNHRPISSSFFYAALSGGYAHAVSPGRYPLVFVFLEIAPDRVDVNIHPAKREVKFHDQQEIFSALQSSVASAFSAVIKRELTGMELGNRSELFTQKKESGTAVPKQETAYYRRELWPQKQLAVESPLPEESLLDIYHKKEEMRERIRTGNYDAPYTESALPDEIKIIGVTFDTYIMVEKGDTLFFIDQHAVEEAYIYRLKKEKYEQSGSSEQLMMPILIELNDCNDFLPEKIKNLNENGFAIETSEGGSFVIRELPSVLSGMTDDAVAAVIAEFLETAAPLQKNIVDEILIRASCREAVKKGDRLTPVEIRDIVERFFKYNITNCPHGRPVYFEMKRDLFEKNFQRKR